MPTTRSKNVIAMVASLLLVMSLQPQARGQARQGQTQAQQATAPTPSATTPAPERPQAVPGGRGRGGISGPGPAIGGEIDETPVVTHHSINVDGKAINYTATVAQMPLKSASGETEAHIFYMAYTLDGVEPAKRPLTFSFNGGPGSASMWVHMGALGPRTVVLQPEGWMPEAPYRLHDNQYTPLDATDIVMIDAIGTGYSRPADMEQAKKFWGLHGDIESFGEFIRMYISRNERWSSPLYLLGESYGTTRSAGVAGYLADQGISFNGITLL